MTAPPVARTPTGRRLQLAALLRHLREQKGLTQEEVGALIWPDTTARSAQNKITRLENGDGGISENDLHALLKAYGTTNGVALELALLLNSGTSQRGRWRGPRAAHPESSRQYVDLEEDAALIRLVAVERIPPLLRSESYLRAGSPPAETVAAILDRQRVLFRAEPAEVYAVLSESCVRRIRGNSRVMAEQITHLLRLSQCPNVTLQLVPFDQPPGLAADAVLERFALLRLPAPGVIGEFRQHLDFAFTMMGGRVYPADNVQPYEQLWLNATMGALSPETTRRFLREMLRSFRAGPKE
ncbi:helix-turn-helix domain-containing protein [Amycolatopsis acidiphila]|uniref:helix-turn-helix domain-containing protein n=1 Tax=Amycolatopsis acidiphila TaxID=715473 RepID=UPI001643B586|nr:helix-turn-helix transcriptional regulator [Amycolatopsis acidiphila]UIJ61471.1 helix-turn-helix domain-containing protein [Amycolatopsis acidiphila]